MSNNNIMDKMGLGNTNGATTGLTNAVTGLTNGATNAVTGLTNAVTGTITGLAAKTNANPNAGNGLLDITGKGAAFKDFMESNNLVAKIAFLLLVIFVFIVVLQISIRLMVYFFKTKDTPYLIHGMVDGSQAITFPQNPLAINYHPIIRSNNRPTGIEFTWSIWIYILGFPAAGSYKHIFSKGDNKVQTAANLIGFIGINNAPGLYLSTDSVSLNSGGISNLTVVMDSISSVGITTDADKAIIPNIPANKWINVIIRCQGSTIDVYINGTITKSIVLDNTPKQNYGDVLVSQNGGFDGNISNFRYYNYALGVNEIQQIVSYGPNTSIIDNTSGSALQSNFNRFFSLDWYLNA